MQKTVVQMFNGIINGLVDSNRLRYVPELKNEYNYPQNIPINDRRMFLVLKEVDKLSSPETIGEHLAGIINRHPLSGILDTSEINIVMRKDAGNILGDGDHIVSIGKDIVRYIIQVELLPA